MNTKLVRWIQHNAVAILLSISYIAIYIVKEIKPEINNMLGACSLNFIK